MEKLQYDSFYKFLVSLGAILITFPFFVLYYFMNIVNDIAIENNTYDMLTHSSQEILNKREFVIGLFLDAFPDVFCIIMLIGLILFLYGGYKWSLLQKEFDKQIILKTKEQESIVQKMTAQEVLIKTQGDMNIGKTSASSRNISQHDMLFKAINLENCYFHTIEKRLGKNYNVQQNVRIARIEYDIIAKAKKHNVDEIYEVKYWPKFPSFSYIKQTIESVEKRGNHYENTMRRNFNNNLIIITSKDNLSKMNELISKSKQRIETSNKLEINIYSTDEIEKYNA